MAEMRRVIDQGLRNELDSKGYICPQCHKSFLPLEVDRLFTPATMTFNCDICSAELIDNENAENVVGSQDRMQRFNRQMRFILEGLRKTEDMVLPAYVTILIFHVAIFTCGLSASTLHSGLRTTSLSRSEPRQPHETAASKSLALPGKAARATLLASSCLWTRTRKRPASSATVKPRRSVSRTRCRFGTCRARSRAI